MARIRLDDGRIIDPRHFEIRDNNERRLTAADKWAIKWADRACPQSPGYSIVVATRRGVIAAAVSLATPEEACAKIEKLVAEYYEKRGGQRPKGKLAAALNFPPRESHALSLACDGVDVLFLRERLLEPWPGAEAGFIKTWLGPNLRYREEGTREEVEKRVLVQPHWKAKAWE